jgi:hypothetical protein
MQKEVYVAPKATFVALQPQERLTVCSKVLTTTSIMCNGGFAQDS